MVEKGSDRGGFFVILSGAAEVETGGAVHVLGPGDFFGEMALLAGSPRTATVRAVQPFQTMVFEAMAFRPFLIENPSVAVTVLEGAADRLNEGPGAPRSRPGLAVSGELVLGEPSDRVVKRKEMRKMNSNVVGEDARAR
jgi:CRP-like cAMP-binding protein